MPGPSAIKFLDVLGWTHPETRVILMTSGDRVDIIAPMLGVERFIGKPVDESTLLTLITEK